MKIALIQTNPLVGDIEGNTNHIINQLKAAADADAALAVFPEQAIIGYPPKDLLFRNDVIRRNLDAVQRIAQHTQNIAAIVGFAEPNELPIGRSLFNAAAMLHNGRVITRWRKRLLPTYDVFDEVRYFESAGPQPIAELNGIKFGLTICEDMWSIHEVYGRPLYAADPVRDAAQAGAQFILNISASPFFHDRHETRLDLLRHHARKNNVPIAFVNQVGGNDELLFDGSSCLVNPPGQVVAQARPFDQDLLLVDLPNPAIARIEKVPRGPAGIHDALVMGLRDYVHKCGFKTAVIGLSGGIDSALVAALATEALGPQNVRGVAMPSRYSSRHSVEDAKTLANNLGIAFSIVEIERMHKAFEQQLAIDFPELTAGVTDENIQARARGVVLMALSNAFGSLLLTTGNKSELAVGYCTLYGDMAGGLAVISDVPKTMVYKLARHINQRAAREIIPENTITKPPSAELRPDQFDQQSLPPYEVLDEILERYEERLQSPAQIIDAGFEPALVRDVIRKIQISEYKRQQAAPGLKVTSRAFGFGRRMPIAARGPRIDTT